MSRIVAAAATAGAFATAGVAARLLSNRERDRRRERRGDDVPFGSVHGPRRTVIASDGVALNVEVDDGPTDGPTLVLVHGWVCTLDTWHYQRLALRGRVRMVLMDHRSHGGSQRAPATSATFEQLADDLRRVIEECVPTGPVVLVGHSMGGMAIQRLAADAPELFGDRVVAVALLSTSSGRLVRQSPGWQRLAPLVRIGGPLLDWGRSFNSYSVVRRWAVGPEADERHADMTDEMILRAPTHVLLDFYPAFVALDLTTGLKALGEVPTVVVCGTKDLLTPIRHSERLVEAIPGARLVPVEGAGHMVMLEENAQVTRVIGDLLEGVR